MKRFGWFALGAVLTFGVLHVTRPSPLIRGGGLERREIIPRGDLKALRDEVSRSTFLLPIAQGALVTWVRRGSIVDRMGLRPGDVLVSNHVGAQGEGLLVERDGKAVILILHTQ